MGTLLSVLTKGWDWSKAIGVNSDTSNGQKHFKEVPINSPIKINTSKGRLYGEFFGEDESPVACILEGFEYPPGKPVVCKEGPKGVAIIEGKGSFIVQQARIKDPNGPTSLLKSGKLAKPVVIGSTAYQFAAFSLSWNAIQSNFGLRVVCFANELPDRILPTEKDRLNYFCIWLNQWWGEHFDEIVQKKRDEKKQLMAECYNPEGIDPWENQCEVLMKLMVRITRSCLLHGANVNSQSRRRKRRKFSKKSSWLTSSIERLLPANALRLHLRRSCGEMII